MTEEKIKEYGISYDKCKEMINGVCSQCGGELTPIETVDNAGNPTYWAGCEPCQTFCWGVGKDVYETAKYLVDERHHIAYSHIKQPKDSDTEEYKKYYRESQIGGTCSLVMSVLYAHKKIKENNITN